ncbi:hypothetical protein ACFPU1_02715 [Thalassorhabdus alkalitolerans]|uniref:Uncharacterized protein n=1 Tax=Thalassorhabdus alkalitolerans TaxID=2282697 RepID=A0ABW0YJ36_9BACI|nr:hypothetical protein [Thalassobacillus sp. C254]
MINLFKNGELLYEVQVVRRTKPRRVRPRMQKAMSVTYPLGKGKLIPGQIEFMTLDPLPEYPRYSIEMGGNDYQIEIIHQDKKRKVYTANYYPAANQVLEGP